MTKSVTIGNKIIGENHPTFVLAEIGFLFQAFEPKNGHPGAKELIDAAIDAGADAVKIQTFRGETWLSPQMEFDMENTGVINGRKHVKPYEVDFATHRKIFSYAKKKGVIVFSTPSHPTDVDLLEKFDPPAYKIGSDDLTNIPLLRYIAKIGKPMIVSTGMSTLQEVNNAYNEITKINKKLILLHCVSNYPAHAEDVNMKVIPMMKKKFGVPIGWSDHIPKDNSISLAAVALGADVVEKHFTINYGNPSPDTVLSADFNQFKELVRDIRNINLALGSPIKKPTERGTVRRINRKSIVANREIKKGEILKLTNPYDKKGDKNFELFRPGDGLKPSFLLTRRRIQALRNISKEETITNKDVMFI